jgi:hypothetical protein
MSFGLPQSPHSDTFIFLGNAVNTASAQFQMWRKPPNRSMCSILAIGGGGSGGNGVIGSNSSAAGGGGGGSASLTYLVMPLA